MIKEARMQPAVESGEVREPFYIIVTLWPLKQQRWLSFSLVFLYSPWSPFHFLQPFFFFPLSSRQFPLPSHLTPLTPLYSNPAPRSVDPAPKPCHNHVESGIWHAGQKASLQHPAHQLKHIGKPGPDIGRRDRNHRSAQLLWLWPAALTLLTTVCREEAPPSSGFQKVTLCASSLRPRSRRSWSREGGVWQGDGLSLEHMAHASPDLMFFSIFRVSWLLEKAILSY